MTDKELTWFKSWIKTWKKYQLIGKDQIYREDKADDLLDDLDKKRWKLVRKELKRRGLEFRENKWVRKSK